MQILTTIIIGFIVGLVARALKPGDDRMGMIMTTLVGVGGAFAGSYLGQVFGIYQPGEPAGFMGAVVGAMVILVLLKMVFGRR